MKEWSKAIYTPGIKTLEGKHFVHPSGKEFTQGDLFPRHMHAGDLSFLESTILKAFLLRSNQNGIRIIEENEHSGGYTKIRARIKPAFFGVREVCGFVQHRTIITLWPAKTVGKAYKTRNGEKTKK